MSQFTTVHHADLGQQRSRYDAAASRFAETLHPAGHGDPPSPCNMDTDLSGHLPRPWPDEGLAALMTAAERAQMLFPGPVGELIHREIHAYLEIGHRFGGDTLISRLAEQVLATPQHRPDATAGETCSRAAIR